MKLGHGKSADWVKAVRGLAAEHRQPNDLAPLVGKLHAATDTYIARKKTLTSYAERDEALLKLMASLGNGPAQALGEVACIHRLSPQAAMRVADDHWDRLGDCLGAEMEVEKALSIQNAIMAALNDDDGRHATEELLAAWKLHRRNPMGGLQLLATYLRAVPPANRHTRQHTLAAALFDTWMRAHAERLRPERHVNDVNMAAQCVMLVTHAGSDLPLAWNDWVPNVAHVNVFANMMAEAATHDLGALLLEQEGPRSTTPPALRTALVACARDAAANPALGRLLTALCQHHAVTQELIVLMREAQAMRGRYTADVIVSTLLAVHQDDVMASLAGLQALAAALVNEPRWSLVAQAVAPYLLPPLYAQLETLLLGFPDTVSADTLITCANRLQGALPLLTDPKPPWLQPLLTWQPNVGRLQALENLRRTAPAPAQVWLTEVLQDLGPTVPGADRSIAGNSDGRVRGAMADTILNAAGVHQELMLQVCALPNCDRQALQRIATYDAGNVATMMAALREHAPRSHPPQCVEPREPQAVAYGGAQAMHALWTQGPCEPLATRWQETLEDGALISQLLASNAYVSLNSVAELLRWVAPEAPANSTLQCLWNFQLNDLKALQRLARGHDPTALWAEALVAYAVHPSYAPPTVRELGDSFVKSARTWLIKTDADTTALWARLVPVAHANEEAVADAMMLARLDGPGMREQLLQVLHAPADANMGWRLACLLDSAVSGEAHAPARQCKRALKHLAARLNLTDALETPPPSLLRSATTGLGLMRPVIDAQGRTRDASEIGAEDATVRVDQLTEHLLHRWEWGGADDWESLLAEEAHCPITGQPMEEPVVASDGQCYEKAALVAWLKLSPVAPDGATPLLSDDMRPHLGLTFAQRSSRKQAHTTAHASDTTGAHPWLAAATETLAQDIAQLRKDIVDLNIATVGLDVDDTAPDTLDALMQVLDTFEARVNVHDFERIAVLTNTNADDTTAQRLWRQADARRAAASFLLTRPLGAWKHLADEVGHSPELARAFAAAALEADEPFLALQALNLASPYDDEGMVAAEHAFLAELYGSEDDGADLPYADDEGLAQTTLVTPAFVWNGIGPVPPTLKQALLRAQREDVSGLMDMVRGLSPRLEQLLPDVNERNRLLWSVWLAGVGLGIEQGENPDNEMAAAGVAGSRGAGEPFTCAICTNECTPEDRAHLTHCSCTEPVCVDCTTQAVRTTESAKGIDRCPTLCGGALTRGDLERLGMNRDEVETRLARMVAAHLQNTPNWRPCTQPNCAGGSVVTDPNAAAFACGLCSDVNGEVEDDPGLQRKLLEGFGAFNVNAHRNGNGIFRECFHCAAPTLKGKECLHMTCLSLACGKHWDFIRGPYYRGTDWVINGTEQLYRPHQDGVLAKLGVYDGINRGVLTEQERRTVNQRVQALLSEQGA